jgi:hypothetical protein
MNLRRLFSIMRAARIFAAALLPTLLLSVAPNARAQKAVSRADAPYRTNFGFTFARPAGWTVKTDEQGQTALLPPGASNNPDIVCLMLFADTPDAPSVDSPNAAEVYEKELRGMLSKAQRVGTPEKVTTGCGKGLLMRWTGNDAEAGPVSAITVAIRYRDGVILLMAIGTQEKITAEEKILRALIASIAPDRNAPPAGQESADTPQAKQWKQRLSGKKLTYLSSINGGSGGGGSSQTIILLSPNGGFTYHSSGSLAVYGEGANASSVSKDEGEGTWRIVTKDSQTVLELRFKDGKPIKRYALTASEGKTFLNGTRYFVTEP